MQLIRHLAWPGIILVVFIALTILGIATGGAGWVALSLLCAWPMLWAVTAWTFRGLRITVTPSGQPTGKAVSTRQSRNVNVPEVLG